MTTLLVLGGSGYIGRHITRAVAAQGHTVVVASRQPRPEPLAQTRALDVLHEPSLVQALAGVDVVVNATTGSGAVIAQGAQVLARAMQQAGVRHLVHLSSQAVYGAQEGVLTESAPLQASLGWYGQAKIDAEHTVQAWAQQGGNAVVLRPGCVSGPGSPLWDQRLAQWLRWGQLGDLGSAGDGWSNLVDVQDVAQAVAVAVQRLQQHGSGLHDVFNLAALDAPRWNGYFADLALSIGAVPLRRIGRRQLWLQTRLLGLPLKVAERLGARLGLNTQALPPGMPPSLLGVFQQHIKLEFAKAQSELGLPLRYPAPRASRPQPEEQEPRHGRPLA
ncbi:MAG: NAD(P)-dependent oxidoreductase [Ideonella sp.]|nr:NAD(P)-dependent oxidoreductase [Ideonella sp.]